MGDVYVVSFKIFHAIPHYNLCFCKSSVVTLKSKNKTGDYGMFICDLLINSQLFFIPAKKKNTHTHTHTHTRT